MDRVRFGRALGYGARQAAKSLLAAAEAAAAPDPKAQRPAPATQASPQPASAARTIVNAQRNIRESTKHAGALGRSVWSPVARFSGVLWLQVTGTFFTVIALFVGGGAWKLRGAPAADPTSSGGSPLLPVMPLFLALLRTSRSAALSARTDADAGKFLAGSRSLVQTELHQDLPEITMYALRSTLLLIAAAAAACAVHAQTTTVVAGGTPGAGKVTKSDQRPKGFSAPVPAALVGAHKIFLSNAGSEAGLFPHPFTGTQDRAYGYLYKAMAGASRFQLVDSPSDADLVMELHLTAPAAAIGDKKVGTEDPLPTFKLTVYDRPTHYILWALTTTVDKANLQKTHDRNFDQALDLLYSELEAVASGKPYVPPAPADKPKTD